MTKKRTPLTSLEVIANELEHISHDVTEIKSTMKGSYVTKEEFEPVKKIVYGLVGLILVTVVGGLLGLVVLR